MQYKVVVTEDDVWVSKEVQRLVRSLKYEIVGEASDGATAVEIVCAKRPDVVLMDIDMPKMDGLEASRLIQETCPTPVVILTAFDSTDMLERASAAGAGAYLVKPAKSEDIERAVTVAIARHGDLIKLREAVTREQMLSREIYHRVKNNMGVIASLLYLQGRASQDEATIDALKESADRIRTMAKVHEILHAGEDPCVVELGDYLSKIAKSVYHGFIDNKNRVGLEIETEPVSVDSETAISCGLVVNELITNSVKYAFPGRKKGAIRLELKELDGKNVELRVSDNGVGLPDGFDLEAPSSLGMQVIISMTDQISGQLEVFRSNTTEFRITFKTNIDEKALA